jgi:propanol-preferring alcohol dehydrogenase
MVLPRIVSLDETDEPLVAAELPAPEPGPGEVRLRVEVCGVCHTELDEIEGRTPPPRLPVVLGHQIVARVDAHGPGAGKHALGARVGVGWIHRSSGDAAENLSPSFRATGRDVNGGYAELMTVHEDYAYPIPDGLEDAAAAPLLCAGAIGYRALRLTGLRDGARLGLMGFGGSGHLVLQLARHLYPRSPVCVFARDETARDLARQLGAQWCGDIDDRPPWPLDAVIDTTPVWRPVIEALATLAPGGRLVINAIRKEDVDREQLSRLSYHDHLWMEREIKTVANITQFDIREFLPIAARIPIRPSVSIYPLEQANRALVELKRGPVSGSKVLVVRR